MLCLERQYVRLKTRRCGFWCKLYDWIAVCDTNLSRLNPIACDFRFSGDLRPVMERCRCYTCTTHTRAYIHHLLDTSELLANVLLMTWVSIRLTRLPYLDLLFRYQYRRSFVSHCSSAAYALFLARVKGVGFSYSDICRGNPWTAPLYKLADR